MARSVRAIHIRWGIWGGLAVGVATIGAFATGIFMIIKFPGHRRSVFVDVSAGLCFLCIPIVWGVALWATSRAFKRVLVAHEYSDAGPRAAHATGRVFLMHIAATALLILLTLFIE